MCKHMRTYRKTKWEKKVILEILCIYKSILSHICEPWNKSYLYTQDFVTLVDSVVELSKPEISLILFFLIILNFKSFSLVLTLIPCKILSSQYIFTMLLSERFSLFKSLLNYRQFVDPIVWATCRVFIKSLCYSKI